MFRVKEIKVFPDCTGRKNLKDGAYELLTEESSHLPEEFYGKNITVSAIVGKNGSGKSSLLDIVYRILNNVSAILCTNLNSPSSHAFYFIRNLRAELTYEDLKGNDCRIKCYDNTLFLDFIDEQDNRQQICFGDCPEVNDGYIYHSSLSEEERAKIMNCLFYCSVVNYAPFTQNSIDYEEEECTEVGECLQVNRTSLKAYNWMEAMFHKNDGYQSPITLTPYRNKGIFDATKESKLARERLLILLIDNPQLIEGYTFSNASFDINPRRFAEKFSLTAPSMENGFKPKMSIRDFLFKFQHILHDYCKHHRLSVAAVILYCLNYKRHKIQYNDTRYLYCYLYLVYKVLNSARYPIFQEYSDLCNPNLAISGRNGKHFLNKVKNLTNAILKEHSHITFKIERTKLFISSIEYLQNDKTSAFHFNLNEYLKVIKTDGNDRSHPIVRTLPPSFFDTEIFLKPKDNQGASVRFERLSSGERLFYVTISSIIYHAMNINSIPEDARRVKYRNMLVVLDETEICFHPDYQRTFLHKLLTVIKRLRFNKTLHFHILLTTHSPFILSDIPASNILFLSEGKGMDARKAGFINPYGANINDILCQSFFLESEGFIGEHTRQTIISLYKFLNNEIIGEINERGIQWNKDSAECVINLIGDPLIKEGLLSMYRGRYRKGNDLRRQIQTLRQELAALESKLQNDTDPD